MPSWALILSLAALLGVAQLLLWGAARGLGLRLHRWVVLAGLGLPFLLLAPWLGGQDLLVPTDALRLQIPGAPLIADPDSHDLLNDAVFQFIPWELEVRHQLSVGRLPLWSDRLGGGSSPWVNPQAGVLSLLAMLTRPLPIQYFLLVALALKMLVACQGAWLLARVMGAGRRAALLAGVAFALGGGILAWGLFPHTRAAAWVPWVTAGAILLTRRPTPLRVVVTGLLTGVLLLAGHPETALAGGLFAALCALWLRRRATPLWRGLGSAAAAALLGFGLAAPQLVPFLSAVGETHRAAEAAARRLPPVPFDFTEPATWTVEGRGRLWLAPVHRHAFGRPYHETFRGPVSWPDASTAYAGVLAFAGVLAALALQRRRRALRPLLVFLAGSLLLASQPLPLMRLLYRLPALQVPAYDRLLLVTALALAVAGALGIEGLLCRRVGWGGWLALAAATAAGVALGPGLATLLLWAGAWGAVLLAWRGRGQGRGWRLAAGVLLAAVLLADLLPWARDHLPVGRSLLFYPPNGVTASVRAEVAAGGPWRVVGEDYLVYPGLLPVYGLDDPRPHNPMAPMAQIRVLGAAFDYAPTLVRYFAPFHQPEQPFLDFLNVRVVVSNRYQPFHPSFQRFDRGEVDPYVLWRNPRALPRWFLASGAEAVEPAALPAWISRLDDPRRVALDPAEAGDWRPVAPSGPEGSSELVLAAMEPGQVLLELPPAPGPGERLLATSQPSPRGWRASTGDGRRLRRLTVNGAFFGAVVPAEVQSVELRFSPPGLGLGWGLFALAAAGGIGLLLQARHGAGERLTKRADPGGSRR